MIQVQTKECLNCHSQFEKKPSFSSNYWLERKLCGVECQSQWMKGKNNSPKTQFVKGGEKHDRSCEECGKGYIAFAPNAKYCSKACLYIVKNRLVKLRPNYRENIRRQSLQQNFGITIEEYDLMVLKQDNRCAICNIHQSEVTRRFAVDHDHKTGEIRGLLCINCNRGIGALKDSPVLLEKAITYLDQKMRRKGTL